MPVVYVNGIFSGVGYVLVGFNYFSGILVMQIDIVDDVVENVMSDE